MSCVASSAKERQVCDVVLSSSVVSCLKDNNMVVMHLAVNVMSINITHS